MRLALNTLGCPAWSFERIVDQAAKLGYQGVEIRGVQGERRAEAIPQFMPGKQMDTLRLLRDNGVELIGFGTSASFHDAAKVPDSIAECRAAIDVARALGMRFIRVFGDAIPDPAKEDETIAQIIGGYKQVLNYANGSGVQVLMEVHGEFNRADRLLRVVQGVDNPDFGLIWDVEHSDKVYGDNIDAFYEQLKPYIKHVHFKDYLRDGKFTICEIGEGDIPLARIAHLLNADGYDGYFAFEWEKMWQPQLAEPEVVFPKYVEFMRTIAET